MFGEIREDFTLRHRLLPELVQRIPVLFFVAGEERRMMGFVEWEKAISKSFLLINGKPIFWNTFIILHELGFRDFYFITTKKGNEIKKYFEENLKNFENVNIQLLTPSTLSEKKETNAMNIYVFENKEKGTGDQLLALKNAIKSEVFLQVYGDEYFGVEGDRVKSEFRAFIEYALEKIEKEKAIEVLAFVDKKIAIGDTLKGLSIEKERQDGKLTKTNESKFIPTSLCMFSTELLNILESEKKESIPLNVASPSVIKRIIDSQRGYGKIIDIEFFSNNNYLGNYLESVLVLMLLKEGRLRKDKLRIP
jgi:NDP-sugar pyrophosphorylase family protein